MKRSDNKLFGMTVMATKLKSIEHKILYLAVLLVVAFFLLPFILFGENSIITIHDNLDFQLPMYKMYHDNGLFFKFDAHTKAFSEMSTLYYVISFSFQSMLYMFFSDFTAYVLSYYFSICLGFLSMYVLLKKTMGFSLFLSFLVAICYAMLPVIPIWNIGVSTIPLIVAIFSIFAFKKDNTFSWRILFLFLFPFFSFFAAIGFFILGFWFIGLVVLAIRQKKVNVNLLIGFVLLCIGYIIVDLRLFYVMFVLKTPLNRAVSALYSADSIFQIKLFLRSLMEYSLSGYYHADYHADSFQRKIIMPFACFMTVFCLIRLIRRIGNQSETVTTRIKKALGVTSIIEKRLLVFEFTVLVFVFIAALYDSKLLNNFIVKYIPLLTGFNWGRVWIFNRILWYIIFAYCLQLLFGINVSIFVEKNDLPLFIPRVCAWVLVCLQLGYIAFNPTYYNDPVKTWVNETVIKTGIAKKIMPNKNFYSFVSYKEFFAEDLFKRIKEDISYADERVVAFGYHPSVLMYNGFNCIDGYNNAYPLSYMQKFRTLIVPELEINQWAREYYDGWGGRMYLYNADLDYQPTRNKNTLPVKLNIDMDVFKNDFDGRYILSRAEISNDKELDLELVKRYYDEESIYTIFLYQSN